MKVIYLDASDDIVSIADRLAWVEDARQILLVVSEDLDVLTKGLDLVRLRRLADRLRLEVGLVASEKGMRQRALALGIPSFPTVEAAQRGRRGWWRGRRRREIVGLPNIGAGVRREKRPFPREVTPEHPARILNRWLVRYLALFLFVVSLAFLTVLFFYYVPQATLTLHPEMAQVEAELLITADPYQAGVIPPVVPARRITTTAVRDSVVLVAGGVTQNEHDRLRQQAMQFLRVVSQQSLAAQLNQNELLVEESVQVVRVLAADFSHEVGQVTDQLGLRLEAEVVATVVNTSQATTMAIAELQTAVPDNFELVLDTLILTPGDVVAVDDEGRVTFELQTDAQAAAVIDFSAILGQAGGQDAGVVQAFLFEQLPLRQPPELAIWPTWFDRLPYIAERVDITVQIGE